MLAGRTGPVAVRRGVAAQVFLLAATLLLCFPGTGHAQTVQRDLKIEAIGRWPTESKRWALIVGVDQYTDPQITPLRGGSNDARLLSEALVRHAGFPSDQIVVLASDQPPERQPTRVNILRRLSNLGAVVPKDGLLLVSFSGHGIDRGGKAFLIPADAQISDDIMFLEETAISVERVREWIHGIGVSQVVVLLDACRNDPMGRADAGNPLSESFVRGFNFDIRNRDVQAFATLYATTVGQRAFESTEKRLGYFTWAVVEGLQGAAAGESGEVVLSRLVNYVEETVPKRVLLDFGAGKIQKPYAHIEGYRAHDLVVAAAPRAVQEPRLEGGADTATLAVAAELAAFNAIQGSRNPELHEEFLLRFPNSQFAGLVRGLLIEVRKDPKGNPPPIEPLVPPRVPDPRPREVRTNERDGLNYVWIPPGSFKMGCVDNDAACLPNERPLHVAEIGEGFWIGRTEVIVAAYKRFAAATGRMLPPEPGYRGRGAAVPNFNRDWSLDDHPIVNVNWNEAAAYCRWAGGRLPSEAEWEYAARGGEAGRVFHSGARVTPDDANFASGSGDPWQHTAPAGSFTPNGFGLFDMAGNVYEWVNDWFHPGYYGSSPPRNPAGPETGELKILRGGSWSNAAENLRLSVRYPVSPRTRNHYIGFRCVASP
jgi:formylglycine-generating enzyme required for sulfatase activity